MPLCASCSREAEGDFAFCPYCAAPFAAEVSEREQRKTVTVLFCDVTGSTSLGESVDPEALRAALARFFERMKGIIESHGGSVEKFIGDAVMAVFGVPVLHEDDALRAVRAATEMRDALPELGVSARIGVSTGEVVTGTAERLVTGDAVNVAARLEQAAQPGEVLLGAETFSLVRDEVDVEALESLALKGKSEPVRTYRLLSMRLGVERRLDAPMVGREREQRTLAAAWQHAASERACQLFTILGAAGVGKSRLASEFLGSLTQATVVRARCLSYGEGITYWPVIDVMNQLLGADAADALSLLELDSEVVEAVLTLLGERQIPTTPADTAWAVRKVLEAKALRSPLVVVFDDIHWGEPTFLDLIEHVSDLSRDVPILLLCLARPELLDERPSWGGGKLNATTVLLEALAAGDAELLIENLLGGAALSVELRRRIREAADGNPLFLEEMLALVQSSGNGEVSVPPTIQALLAARIDQLAGPERDVLQRGAVEGQVFHGSAVAALGGGESRERLSALVRKELIRPERAQMRGEDAYRFRHLLIRDAAYDALPKAKRAELHERFVDWLTARDSPITEQDEIVGYHLEQAARYKAALGRADAALARRASELLGAAGLRAHERRDITAAENLLERALALVPEDERDVKLELELIEVLYERGRLDDRHALVERVSNAAARRGDRLTRLRARLGGSAQILPPHEVEAMAEEAVELLADAGDPASLAAIWWAIALMNFNRCQGAKAIEAADRSLQQSRLAGNVRLQVDATGTALAARCWGPTPVTDALEYARSGIEVRTAASRIVAVLEAMQGSFALARGLLEACDADYAQRGSRLQRATVKAQLAVMVELLAGDPEAAIAHGLEGYEELAAMRATAFQATAAVWLAQAFLAAGRPDEAERWSRLCEELSDPWDVFNEIKWRWTRAVSLTLRGQIADGEQLARGAVELASQTDCLVLRGEAHTALASVLTLSDRSEEAAAELESALRLYEQKGATVLVEQTLAGLAKVAR
jgi:class 3 adenylate cyclase/tetratricopeptide (TPR) repeat protein